MKDSLSTPPETEMEAETIIEDTDVEGNVATQKDKLNQLREKYRVCDVEKRQLLEDLQRAKADFLNSKRRLEEEHKANRIRSENALLLALLPLADSFTMAKQDSVAWEAIDEAWRNGITGIENQLAQVLKKHDVTPIDPQNQPFDPTQHEAVGSQSDDSGESGLVMAVVQLGYRRGDTILRPAKVVLRA